MKKLVMVLAVLMGGVAHANEESARMADYWVATSAEDSEKLCNMAGGVGKNVAIDADGEYLKKLHKIAKPSTPLTKEVLLNAVTAGQAYHGNPKMAKATAERHCYAALMRVVTTYQPK